MNTSNGIKQPLKLAEVTVDPTFQMRVALDNEMVKEYGAKMSLNEQFPPISVFKIGEKHFLVDGFHRYQALKNRREEDVDCNVYEGSRADAIEFGITSNNKNGLRYTNEDKHKAVDTLLKEEEFRSWSDPQIAKLCGVSHTFVTNKKNAASCNGLKMPEKKKVKRGNQEYEMKPRHAKGSNKPHSAEVKDNNAKKTRPSIDETDRAKAAPSRKSITGSMSNHEEPTIADQVLALSRDLLPLLGQLSRQVPIISNDLVVQMLKNLESASHDLLGKHYKAIEEKERLGIGNTSLKDGEVRTVSNG